MQNPTDALLKHLRSGSGLYLRLAAVDKRWVPLRLGLVILHKNRHKIWAQVALDALRVRVSERMTPAIIAALQLDEAAAPNHSRPRQKRADS